MNPEISKQAVKAVIYCRVSSVAQLQKGHGNGSQETRCREFARLKNYNVEQVFSDEAVSGGLIDRPGIKAMLTYLKDNKRSGNYVVLIDDISRLARDIKAHLELRGAISSAGARLESPSVEFGEDSDSILVENLLASVSQHQRQKNAEQTRNRMRARIQSGYWPFISCIGYRHLHSAGEGKLLVRDEPYASIIQEALEGFASGRFQIQAEVKRFLELHPEFPRDKSGQVRNQFVNDILTKPLYAGYVEMPDWGIPLRKGRHEGLIDLESFERIQLRLKQGAYVPARADVRSDFPLRGAVSCACCGHPLTANWSKSKTGKRYPYYMCFEKGCERNRKSIRRDQIESEFVALLHRLKPAPKLLMVARSMFKNAWEQRKAMTKELTQSGSDEIAKLDKQIETLLDRIVDASSASVVTAYEKRINALERSKLLVQERREKAGLRHGTFEELFELAFRFLANPVKLWDSGNFQCRKMVLQLTFSERLEYCPAQGFRTPKTTIPFNMLVGVSGGENKMAERKSA